ncbi:hypothetical protein FGF1_39130 [Flavobacteriaceae bacterium GF1]
MESIRIYIIRLLGILKVEKSKNRQFEFFPVRLSAVEAKEKVSRTRFLSQKFASRYNSEYSESLEVTNFYSKWVIGIFLLAMLTSCTDVVDVEVQNGPERLVVEASLDWEKGTPGNVQTIRLRKSTPFFDTSTTTDVTGASVVVTNDTNGTRFVFADQNNGSYQTTTFEPILGQSYSLRIEHEGEVYTARETMTPVTEITNVFQDREEGFDDEVLEVHIVFTDPPEEGNNYLFRFQRRGDLLPDLEVAEDEFVNGREIDWWYEIDDDDDDRLPFEPGDVVDIEMYGISTPYYDYIKILVDQLGGQGLFETTPVAVKGNCINETNSENYPFGYFRLTEVVKTSYTFVEDE